MIKLLTVLLALILSPPHPAFAQRPLQEEDGITVLKSRSKTFKNADCRKRSTCDLVEVRFVVEDYRVRLPEGFNYGTRLRASYQTRSLPDLENYVFVEFVRGGVYTSVVEGGRVKRSFDYAILSFDNFQISHLPNWVIESEDTDPAYNSRPGLPRHYLYRWNKDGELFNSESEFLYGQARPDLPILYVLDSPGTAFYANRKAKNLALEFRMCLYKAAEVPQAIAPDNLNFAEPLFCFPWKSYFTYNHRKSRFE